MSNDKTEKFRPTSDASALQDTEAHVIKGRGIRADDEETEVEGHRLWSDRTVKHDVEDVTWDEADENDETEGHRMFSDRTVKHDVEDVTWDEADENEGHSVRGRG
jgi:hypothetical protein